MSRLARYRRSLVFTTWSFALGFLILVAAPGRAQSLLLTLDTPGPQERSGFGMNLALGDVNGDGKLDIAAGAGTEDVGDNANQGRAYVFSGADGSLLFTLDTPNPQLDAHFGDSVAVGDVNGDGKADIVVGAWSEDVGPHWDQGRAYVFSGADGSLLFTLETKPQTWAGFGGSLAVGDMNGDGRAEVAVAAGGELPGPPPVHVFSGADGSLLRTLRSPNPQAFGPFAPELAVGDVNGDGTVDIAMGCHSEEVEDNWEQGAAYVFSGTDGSLLLTLDVPNPQEEGHFGHSVAVGDVNGDSKADIAVGAGETVGPNAYQGRAYVFSGADGSLLLTLDTPNPQAGAEFGRSLAVGDVNGDGKGDVTIGADGETVDAIYGQGRAYIFSGADGSLLLSVDSPNPQDNAMFGLSLAMGDASGDGKADLVVGTRETLAGNTYQGRVYVFSPDVVAPTPVPPASGQMRNCPWPGKWAIAVWDGADGAGPGQALASCGDGGIDAAYYLDPQTQSWLRWFAGRPEVSTLDTLNNLQGVMALGGAMAGAGEVRAAGSWRVPQGPEQMHNCPQPGKWAISVWTGASGTATDQAVANCTGASVEAVYWIDPQAQDWKRYFAGRPGMTNLETLDQMQGIIVLGG